MPILPDRPSTLSVQEALAEFAQWQARGLITQADIQQMFNATGQKALISPDPRRTLQNLEMVLEPKLKDLRFLDTPCDTKSQAVGTTEYDFTDYDLYSLFQDFVTLPDLKASVGSDNAPPATMDFPFGPSKPFVRRQPKDWYKEAEIEFRFIGAVGQLAKLNRMTEAIALMDKMIRHKMQGYQSQWITPLPELVEIGQSKRVTGRAAYNGRYKYAIARASQAPEFFYITTGMAPNFVGNGGEMTKSGMSGRVGWESGPHKIGESNMIFVQYPDGLYEIPPTLDQSIRNTVSMITTFALQFGSFLFSVLTFGQNADSIADIVKGGKALVGKLNDTVAAIDRAEQSGKRGDAMISAAEAFTFAGEFADEFAELVPDEVQTVDAAEVAKAADMRAYQEWMAQNSQDGVEQRDAPDSNVTSVTSRMAHLFHVRQTK